MASVDDTDDFLRRASRAELAAVVALVRHAYRQPAAGGWTTEAHLVEGPRVTLAALEEWSRQAHHRVLVHPEGDRVLACCHLEGEPHPGTPPVRGRLVTVHFGLLAVDPARQSRGLGTSVLASAEEVARLEMGATQLSLTVISRRREVVEWYRRKGFVERPGWRAFEDVAPSSERPLLKLRFVTMVKGLGPPLT